MQRFLFTTDWHIADRRPGTRIDEDYFETQIAKVEEILSIAEDEKVDKIYHGGDVFERALMDLHIINTLIQLLKKSKVPIEVVKGNHDLLGYNINTVSRTALGTLLKAGVMREATIPHVNITNHHHSHLYKLSGPIIISHNMLSPDVTIFEHILCEKVAEHCPNTLVLCGHYHRSFKYVSTQYNTTFINPGCMMRNKISEIRCQPQVVIGEGNQILKVIPLKTAKPGAQIFNLELHQETQKRNTSFEKFVSDLKQAKGIDTKYDLMQLVQLLALKLGLTEDVRQEAIKRIQESRNALSE